MPDAMVFPDVPGVMSPGASRFCCDGPVVVVALSADADRLAHL